MAGTTLQERGLPSPHTQPQRRSDPSHLNYQHNSDYTCILCTEPQWSSPGRYPHVHRVIWISPPLCVGARAPELKERTRKSFKKYMCSHSQDFRSFPINHCILLSRPPPLLPVLPLLLQHTSQNSSKSCLWSSGRRGCLPWPASLRSRGRS